MSLRPLSLLCFSLCVSASCSSAAESTVPERLQLSVHDEVRKSTLSVGLEYASLQTSVPLSGYGLTLGFSYALSRNWELGAMLSQIFDSKGFSYLYTGLGASVKYSVFGSFLSGSHEVSSLLGPVVKETQTQEKIVAIGIGAEQLLINGSTQVYPASGITVQASYHFPVFAKWWVLGVRAGSFSAAQKTFSALFLNLSIPFEL